MFVFTSPDSGLIPGTKNGVFWYNNVTLNKILIFFHISKVSYGRFSKNSYQKTQNFVSFSVQLLLTVGLAIHKAHLSLTFLH